MADFNRYQEYLCRQALAEGHRKFGIVTARKEPKDDDEGGAGSAGLQPDFIKPHPLLADAAQFSGEFPDDTPVTNENPAAQKELQLRLEAKLDKQKQAEKHINPTPLR